MGEKYAKELRYNEIDTEIKQNEHKYKKRVPKSDGARAFH
jgi:hypothetical protein